MSGRERLLKEVVQNLIPSVLFGRNHFVQIFATEKPTPAFHQLSTSMEKDVKEASGRAAG